MAELINKKNNILYNFLDDLDDYNKLKILYDNLKIIHNLLLEVIGSVSNIVDKNKIESGYNTKKIYELINILSDDKITINNINNINIPQDENLFNDTINNIYGKDDEYIKILIKYNTKYNKLKKMIENIKNIINEYNNTILQCNNKILKFNEELK